MSVKKIAAHLGVAVSSVSVWTRDVAPPMPEEAPEPVSAPDVCAAGLRRRCGRCAEELPLTAFNRAGSGHQHWCRGCSRAYARERREIHSRQVRAAKKRRRDEARVFVLDYLHRHPCVDCGEDDVLVLEFDHRRAGKTDNVGTLLSAGRRVERVRQEIEMCDVVCANWNRRRTARRRGFFRFTREPPPSWDARQHRNNVFPLDFLDRSPCVDCGEADPVVLDFDHVGGKRAAVTRLAMGCSLATLQREIERCVIRCANCHRLRTLIDIACWRAEDHWAVGLHSNPEARPKSRRSSAPGEA